VQYQGSAGDCIIGSFLLCLLTKYYSDDNLNKSEMGGACGTHGREQGLEVGCGEET
jgi:hypothetical protein